LWLAHDFGHILLPVGGHTSSARVTKAHCGL
jgi:hypothetical protein